MAQQGQRSITDFFSRSTGTQSTNGQSQGLPKKRTASEALCSPSKAKRLKKMMTEDDDTHEDLDALLPEVEVKNVPRSRRAITDDDDDYSDSPASPSTKAVESVKENENENAEAVKENESEDGEAGKESEKDTANSGEENETEAVESETENKNKAIKSEKANKNKDVETENEKRASDEGKSNATGEKIEGKYAIWNAGEPAPFLVLARAFSDVTKTRAKLTHIEIMRELFLALIQLSPADIVPAIYISTNRLGPAYEGLELGVGEQIIQKAISDATGKSLAFIKGEYKKLGDLGLVAQACSITVRTLKPPKPLTISGVFNTLHQIATESGSQSIKKKQDRIRNLLVSCRESESQFIVKALQGHLRINLGPKSVIAGLAQAFAYYENGLKRPSDERLKEAVTILNSTFSELPDWQKVIDALRQYGLDALPQHCHLTVGIPVEPMLAQPTKSTKEILERLQGHSIITAEYKYDGERAQIHRLPDGTIKIYSRNLEDNTGKFPDIIRDLPKAIKPGVESFILDSEAVAFDRTAMKILPFQILSTRSRKEVDIGKIKVMVCLYVFDLLYLNGEPLIKLPLAERRKLLKENFQEVPGEFMFATSKEFEDVEDLPVFLNEAVENQCEGLMVKAFVTNAEYIPAKRSYHWLKLKKDYMDGMTDTVDLVPIGAWKGKGKRTGVYGAYLLAVYNDEDEEYQCVCKIGSGFTDAQLAELSESLSQHVIPEPRPYYRYDEDAFRCDVWFDPVVVWEVRAADLTLSPVHKAAIGLVSESKGIALRFPRFVRVRTDKEPENATTATQIAEMYRNQKIHTNHTSENNDDDV